MIPNWLLRITKAVFEWHGSLPDWLALLVAFLFACVLCALGVGFLFWLDGIGKPKAPSQVCHRCGKERQVKNVITSSDARHQGTPLCHPCFDEVILQERWAHLPGIKWFDGGAP